MQTDENQKVIYSAIKPTGNPTLGNYLGALKRWPGQAKDGFSIFNVADLHAITIAIDPKELRENTKRMFALLIAIGLDPDESLLFLQSGVSAHAELGWVLNCYTLFGEARRMTQFKDKSKKQPQNVNVGLFDYPVLMAADILLYQTDYVPVGKDQVQHVELARNIAERFNNRYSPTFKVPQVLLPKEGEKICSLTDPTAKMGKSDEDGSGTVYILDTPDDIMRKFKRAVTDCGTEIKCAADKPGVTNLLKIYASLSDITVKAAEEEFAGKSYAEFKTAVGERTVEVLRPIREKYNELRSDEAELENIMKSGAEKAARIAYKTLAKVYRKIGFVRP